jgi:hypothetical protein
MPIKKPASPKTISIHGKDYVPVAERVRLIHERYDPNGTPFSIKTRVLPIGGMVVVKATVETPDGVFTGISGANPDKVIEKQSPYEVAETSAVGRALGFAGYGAVDSIASADEMAKTMTTEEVKEKVGMKTSTTTLLVSQKQIGMIYGLLGQSGVTEDGLHIIIAEKLKKHSLKELTTAEASQLIDWLIKKKGTNADPSV